MLTDKECEELGRSISELVQQRGLGAISKKDYELVVFHHLAKSSRLKAARNYDVSNALKITDTRVKALRLEASIRHSPPNHKAILATIVQRIIDEIDKPDFSGHIVSIALEDPVERREFEHAAKLAKHPVEYGFNREILKISPLALFEIVLSNLEKAEEGFKQIVQAQIKSKARQQEILDNSLTFGQRIKKLSTQVSENGGVVALLSGAAGLLL